MARQGLGSQHPVHRAGPLGGGGSGAGAHPFMVTLEIDSGGNPSGHILATTASYLHKDYLAASGLTITGINTAFDLASDTHAWIEVTVDTTSVEATAAELKTGTAFPEPAQFTGDPAAQNKYNLPVGRVVADAQPGMPGFDFKLGTDTYHWQQLLREHQIMESYCFSGTPGLKAFPWQGI